MADETKMPCTAGCREETAGFVEDDPLCTTLDNLCEALEAAQTLWAFLPAWMAARDMVSVDAKYNKRISGLIAENAAIILKAAQEMAESEPEADE